MGEAVVFGLVVLMLVGIVIKIVVDDRRQRAGRGDGGRRDPP